MKFKNKILASLVAVVMLFGVFALPTKAMMSAFGATNVSLSSESLIVKNVDKSYDLVNNNTLNFADYVDETIVPGTLSVQIFKPNGKSMTLNSVEQIKFTEPGLHAMYFSKLTSAGYCIYSDVIYIPVSSGEINDIELDGEFYPMVLPNTVVECPLPLDENGEVDLTIRESMAIYTPYGETVTATTDNVTKRYKFTNKQGVLGKYFVEYKKEVMVGGSPTTLYRYETIEFSSNATTTVSTKYYSSNDVVGEVKINIEQTGLKVKDEKNIYLFKYYDIDKAVLIDEKGEVVPTAEIYLTIFDEDDDRYYNFDNGKFDKLTSSEARELIKDNAKLKNFNLQSIDHFSSLGKTGHDIKFTYTANVNGKDIVATQTLKEDFNEKALTVTTATLAPSEVLDIVIVSEVEGTTLGTVEFPAVKVDILEGYNADAIKQIIKKTYIEIDQRSGNKYESTTKRTAEQIAAGEIGIDVKNEGDFFNQSYVFNYNKQMLAGSTWQLKYVVTFGDAEGLIAELPCDTTYTIYVRENSEDQTPPSKLTINGGAVVSTDGTYIVPTATAEDQDNNFKNTTGATISVVLVHPNGTEDDTIELGEKLEGLADGTYTLRYVATDYAGNTRTKTLKFKVMMSKAPTNPVIDNGGFDYIYEDGKVKVTLDSSADGVTIFANNKGQFSPEKMTVENGRLVGFEFSHDNTTGCVVVLRSSNSRSTVYRAVELFNIVGLIDVRPVQFSENVSGFTKIIPNIAMEVNPFQKLLWTGSNSFEVEAPEDSLYRITDSNHVEFYTAGTYKITSNETYDLNGVAQTFKTVATITVKSNNTSFADAMPLGHKLVAKTGEEVKLNMPIITNYFGYEMHYVVKDSTGRDVTDECLTFKNEDLKFMWATFVAPRNDEYTVLYTYTADGVTKFEYPIVITTGNVAVPQISIAENNKNVVWEGEKIKYVLQNASAIDKNGNTLDVAVKVFDQYGKEIAVKKEGVNRYVDIEGAGFYTIRYSAVDADGKLNLVESVFAVEFPEEEDENSLSVWAIIGIILGSIVGAGAIALVVFIIIKNNKKKIRFINKSKQVKKQEKKDISESVKVYTIAETKDEKHWLAKAGNRTIAKVNSKQEAIDKIKEVHKKGEYSIKVYNKNGRLIDSI